ncbi:hypothetical protein TWF481_007108 [Arthrobotrys musiformis]|uniref:DUF6594 domain-containing protein n=1 Tax=Arthrobotrys musiformis TaxID=47236 RepID=A0AAV9WBG0_9PEZI
MGPTLDIQRPPYPTAETVIDSEDELDNLDERITVGNHKPNKGGIDSWVNKPAHKKNKSVDKTNNGSNSRTGASKDKNVNKRWSLGVTPLTVNTSEKRQHPQGRIRTMSMSEATRQGFAAAASEKPTHILTSLPLSSSSSSKNSSSNNHSLPTPAASPSSTTPPIDTKIGPISSSISTSAAAANTNGNYSVTNLAAKFSAAAAQSHSKNISSSSSSSSTAAVVGAASRGASPTSKSNRPRPRSYSAYPSSASYPSETFVSSLHKPPTPVSISEDDEGESEGEDQSESEKSSSHHLAMPALKKPQMAGQQVPLAPSSVVSASSGSSSPSESSSGSSLEEDTSRRANFRKLSGLQTQNNGYFPSVSDEVQSPMPEAPAPPSRGSNSAAASEASSSEDMKSGEQKHQGFAPPNPVPTPKSAAPPSKNNINNRPPAHSRTYSNATVTGPEYDQDAYGQDAYGAYPYPPIHRKRNSFSSSGSRQTAIAGIAQGAPAGLGLDASVFEFLDEGEEDEAAHEEEHQTASEVSAPIPEPSPAPSRQAPAPAPEPRPKTPVKPASPKKATPTSATAPPRATPSHPQDPYFSSPQSYGAYGGYPMHYDPYMATDPAAQDPTLQPAPPMPPMVDPYKNLPHEALDNAMVHTPQKSNFKESVHARRAAAAAAAAEAQAQATVAATEIEEYHEDDYPSYSSYVSPQAPPSYRGRPRMAPNQRAPPPPPPPAAHDMYAGYPPHQPHQQHQQHPPPPPPQRAFQEAYPPPHPHPHPHPHQQPYRQQPPPQQRGPMYPPGPQYNMRGQRPPPPTSSLNGGYGKSLGGSQVSSYSPNFGSMLNSNVSEMATTVLGGRWNHMNSRQQAPSNLSMAYNQPGYDDYYGSYEGYYDQGQYHQEETEYEEPHSIPSASPQYSKRRPNSGEFGTPNKRNSIHSQWTAEWADTDSVKGGSRPPTDRVPEGPSREEFELGKDGNDDQSWAKPAKTRRRNTITPSKQTMFSSNFSDTSSAKLTSAASSRMQPLSEADIKSEASVEQSHPRQPPSINTSLPSKQKHGLPTPEDSPPAIKPCRAQSRPPTRHSSVAGSFLSKGGALTTIPVALGYPHLSNHLAATPNSAMYRRFDNLNHRILLHLQDEICELESILESLDNAEKSSGGGAGLRTRRGLNQAGHRAPGPLDERSARRLELMGAIFVKLQQYNNALAAYSKILNELPGATNDSVREYREWMTLHQPVVPEEMDFVFKANDFSNLINDGPVSTPMRVHIPSGRSSRSPSFASAQKPSLPVEGVLTVLDTLITWIMKQETPVQLGILAGIFFLVPLLLFLCVSTWFGMFMVMTACTAGFAYCAKDLLSDALKAKVSKPVDGKSDATNTNNTPVGMKA